MSFTRKRTQPKRYKNWMMDLLERQDAHLYVYKRGSDLVGYGVDVLDQSKKVVYGILGGVFAQFQNEGLGCIIWDIDLMTHSKNGFEQVKTTISSNNATIMRLYMALGYTIQKQTYVLRKFYEGEK